MIEINDLSFCYKGEEKLFSSLCLKMERKKPVLIIADPGLGKTTLARILTGPAEKFYSGERTGSFLLDGMDLFSLDIPERKSYVARSSQNSDESILFPTVVDEIAFPLEQRNLEWSEMDGILRALLERYDLMKYHDADTSELSGGEKRRLNLAVLDAINPRLCIYDEAFDDLSIPWRRRLLSIISEKEYALVLGSHYLSEYDGFFDSVYELKDGKLVNYERRRSLFSFPSLQSFSREDKLSISSLTYTQSHRAMEDERPFELSVSSLELKSGEVALLTGENGAGKSTLAKVITGINEESGGFILLNGRRLRAKERKRLITYLFQNPFNQLYLPTVKDELSSVSSDEDEIRETADLFSLSLDDYTQELSYGKAKMLQAAIFYILDRPFVLFDEVDSAVSYESTEKMLSLYLGKGAGVLMISHDERIISSFSGRRYNIEGGRI